MAGGHATHSGIGFQDKVAAIIAVYALANEPLPLFGLPTNPPCPSQKLKPG